MESPDAMSLCYIASSIAIPYLQGRLNLRYADQAYTLQNSFFKSWVMQNVTNFFDIVA